MWLPDNDKKPEQYVKLEAKKKQNTWDIEMAIGILHHLRVLLDLVSSLGWVFGQFHGRHGEVSSASQQTAWLGLWTTHHGNSAWTLLCLHGGIKDILWLNCHFLGPTIGFQYGQHLFNPVVCLLDHLWWLGPLQSLFGRQPWLQIISTNALAEPP